MSGVEQTRRQLRGARDLELDEVARLECVCWSRDGW